MSVAIYREICVRHIEHTTMYINALYFDNYYVILSTRVFSGKVRLSIVKIMIKKR